jgi:UDP-N-acetylglucosamine 2-epimerase (non-hydrolysing)
MKILTILGTRPEIIRLSLILPRLDGLVDHRLVHTGQNYDPKLNEIFFQELGVRNPDHYLGVREDSPGRQIGKILMGCESLILEEKPDRLLLLGDTNSALSAVMAKRMGIPVYHMEAGNRCYDDRVPEEVNRRIIDHSSDVFMPYTERSRTNLLREGIFGDRIYVVGNPIFEVIQHFMPQIESSNILRDLGLQAGGYFLVTMHRAENVDVRDRLASIMEGLSALAQTYGLPIIVSTHPHTRDRMAAYGMRQESAGIRFLEPFGFFDFIALEQGSLCVLTDSGTVQEECAILGRPSVTLRDTTERPETVECGSNILSGVEPGSILRCTEMAKAREGAWKAPPEYLVEKVSETVVNILLGYLPSRHYQFP